MSLRIACCTLLLAISLPASPQQPSETPSVAAAPTAPSATPELDDADKSFRFGQFAEASAKYRAILAKDASSVRAQAGLVRSTLHEQKLDEALDLGLKFEAANSGAASLHTAVAEVRFRRAEMVDAEREFRQAIALDSAEVRAFLGMAQLLDALALHRKAYEFVERAHENAPNDPLVQRRWLAYMRRKDKIAFLRKYLVEPDGDDPDRLRSLQHYLEFLEAIGDKGSHPCTLAKPVASTETPLEPLMIDANRIRGWGLKVRFNDHAQKLLLDTGASGLLIGRKAAEKAGVVRISTSELSGIGDKGAVSGYVGYVDSLQIGELQFKNCIVEVVDRNNVADEDGLVGADVFASYLISLDFRERKMRLDPLPKPPDEVAPAAPSLATEGSSDNSGSKEATDAADSSGTNSKQATDVATAPPRRIPHDRYVASEMKSWTTVFRFGHDLLVPTKVNDIPNNLFLLDTGAFANTVGKRLADRLGKVSKDDFSRVHGLSGNVNQVYRVEDATLEFGGLRQVNKEAITLDLATISRHTGTEVSGILGFRMLGMLDIQIDYRDNLVHFIYDPTKLGLPDWNKKK